MTSTDKSISYDSKESTQKIQIRYYHDETDETPTELLKIFKGQKMAIQIEEQQTHLDMETGEVKNAKAEILPESISMSCTVLENTQVWTITATFSDLDVAQHMVTSRMVGCLASVVFKK